MTMFTYQTFISLFGSQEIRDPTSTVSTTTADSVSLACSDSTRHPTARFSAQTLTSIAAVVTAPIHAYSVESSCLVDK